MRRKLFVNLTDAEIEQAFIGAQYDAGARDKYLENLSDMRETRDGDESVYTEAR